MKKKSSRVIWGQLAKLIVIIFCFFKYEFNIKVEQIKKLVNKKDFATAMKISDTIDWRRVRNANLLSMISQVYEKNREYQEAKEVLLLAYERAPIGKRHIALKTLH